MTAKSPRNGWTDHFSLGMGPVEVTCSPEFLSDGTEVLKKVVFSDFLWKVAGNLLDKIFCENDF